MVKAWINITVWITIVKTMTTEGTKKKAFHPKEQRTKGDINQTKPCLHMTACGAKQRKWKL